MFQRLFSSRSAFNDLNWVCSGNAIGFLSGVLGERVPPPSPEMVIIGRQWWIRGNGAPAAAVFTRKVIDVKVIQQPILTRCSFTTSAAAYTATRNVGQLSVHYWSNSGDVGPILNRRFANVENDVFRFLSVFILEKLSSSFFLDHLKHVVGVVIGVDLRWRGSNCICVHLNVNKNWRIYY